MNTKLIIPMKCIFIFLVTIVIVSCADTVSHTKGVYMLLDTSGTYTKELKKAQNIINYLLGTLQPGDSLGVGRIDTGSFSEKDIIAKVTFDDRPSVSNTQKRKFAEVIGNFVGEVKGSGYTDITGGMLQGIEWLDETGAGTKYVLIFSDMQEEIKKGYKREGIPLNLKGYKVVALNVTKLRTDNIDPRIYMDRMENWRMRVEEGGGSFKVINDLEKLEGILTD